MSRHPDGIHIATQPNPGDPITCRFCGHPVHQQPNPERPGEYRWQDSTGRLDCPGSDGEG